MSENLSVFKSPDSFHEQLKAIKPIVESKMDTGGSSDELPVDNEPHESHEEPREETNDESHDEHEERVEASDEDEEPAPRPKKENHLVPRSRLKEETEKRNALEEKLNKESEARIRLETQIQMLHQAQQFHNQQTAVPEKSLDQVDALDYETHNIYKKEINKLKEQMANISQQATKQAEDTYLYNTATAQENSFEKTKPDYKDAVRHLADIEMYDAEMEHGKSPEAKQLAAQKLQKIVKNVLRDGGNAPEVLYYMAVKKGYRPSNDSSPAKRGSNLEAINENMKKSASISNLGSGVAMSASPLSANPDKLRKDPKNPRSPFDPDKFHKAMQQIQRSVATN
jgi:hypothetical protein